MKSLRSTLFILPALLLSASPLLAQDKPRVSPHETVNATVGDAKVKIVYGRPYSKDPKSGEKRKIWGTLVPYSKVWRMGADEATLLTTDKAITIVTTVIAPGTYSLYLWPEEGGAKLIVNKQTGQWGTKYDEKQDLARIDLKKLTVDKQVDQFTIAVDDGVLKLLWEDVQYSAPIAAKSWKYRRRTSKFAEDADSLKGNPPSPRLRRGRRVTSCSHGAQSPCSDAKTRPDRAGRLQHLPGFMASWCALPALPTATLAALPCISEIPFPRFLIHSFFAAQWPRNSSARLAWG